MFLEMGDIDFKPQFAGLSGNNLDIGETVIPEQIFLRGQERLAIDLEKENFLSKKLILKWKR